MWEEGGRERERERERRRRRRRRKQLSASNHGPVSHKYLIYCHKNIAELKKNH